MYLFHIRDRRGVLPKNGCCMYTDPSHVSVVTLEWSEITGSYNTPDIAVKDKR